MVERKQTNARIAEIKLKTPLFCRLWLVISLWRDKKSEQRMQMMNTSLYKCYIDYANAIVYAYIRPCYFSVATKSLEILLILDLMASRDDWKYDLWIHGSFLPSPSLSSLILLLHRMILYFLRYTRLPWFIYISLVISINK